MERLVQGDHGGILALRELVDAFSEEIAADFLAAGRSIDDIGRSISWFELRSWLRRPPSNSWYARACAAQAAEEAKPAEERAVGQRSDAIPIDEMDQFLGWT